MLTKHAHGNLILRNSLSGNVPFGIKLVNLDNTVIENDCMRSSPAGLCGSRSNGVDVIRVVIPFAKSAIRIIADGDRVILDGNRRIGAAFVIRGANNVEINGFIIRNYVNAGIRATSIDSKLIGNEIQNITQGNGIELRRAFSTLIWRIV
ncbi:hypothetical protein [Alicyclobacillus fastidiosus]|uniref:hypothetical protein n=1 Tax=Alicyclobacillus fastidiosus TaxID=392011 RepID=UPI0024E10EEE|nr:hypothetical protein [Alicyclobacillus fastidiosus]